jgi:hypothetical protein
VLQSDDDGFPVESGVTSHQACLEAVKDAHVLVSLIGMRYGGATDRKGKSITWLEYDAARDARVYPIVLIRKDANDLAARIAKRRGEIESLDPTKGMPDVDKTLVAEFPDIKPFVHNLPAQQRFIDAVRKGHTDNWVHPDWSGTPDHALAIIHSRLASLLSSTLAKHERALQTAGAMRNLVDIVSSIGAPKTQDEKTASILRLLRFCEEQRESLFGFRKTDRHNFMIYRRDGDYMVPGPRATHPEIPQANRRWIIGEAHVGRAVLETRPLVTPDVYEPKIWYTDPDTTQEEEDRHNYVSFVSVPLPVDSGSATAVLTVTSSRSRHFVTHNQDEVLTAVAVGRILGKLLE